MRASLQMKSPKLITEIISYRNGNGTRESHADTWCLGPSIGNSLSRMLRKSYVQLLTTIQVMVAHASAASSKPKLKLALHEDTCVVGHDCLVVHYHNRPVNVYSYNPIDGHRSAKTVDATVNYQDLQSVKSSLDDKSSYLHRWVSQQCPMYHAVLPERCAY